MQIYYVMLEDDKGAVASAQYSNFWKTDNNVEVPMLSDTQKNMHKFIGNQPGSTVVIDTATMELLYVSDGGDMGVYKFLLDLYQ